MKKLVVAGVVAVVVTVSLASLSFAAQPVRAPAPDALGEGSRVVLDWKLFREITKHERPGEAKVTLPWKEVQDLLGIEVENVQEAELTLDWRQFTALLKWSMEQKKPKEPTAPTDYVIASSNYVGTLGDDAATFVLNIEIDVLKKDEWKRIPVLPATVALSKVTLPEGCFLNVSGGKYELLTTSSGRLAATIEFAVEVTERAGAYGLRFATVPSGTSVLKLTVQQEKVTVNVAGAQAVLPLESKPGETTVGVSLPSGAPVQASWERALEDVAKLPPKLYAETQTLVAVGEGILTCRERVDLSVLHAGIRSVTLSVPAGVSVLDVSGSAVHDWRAADGKLDVRFAHEVTGTQRLSLTYEQAAATADAGIEAPVIRVPDAIREKGYIGVVALANVEISAPKHPGATSIDARELPVEILRMTSQPVLLAFRYVGKTLSIPLAIKKHEDVPVLVTLSDSAVLTIMQTMDGRRITKAIYNVRNNRNQFLRLKLPAGADVWSASVAGKSIRPALDEGGKVLIPLVRSGSGRVVLSSFPVELVYVEKQDEVKEKGSMKIDLPRASDPVTHLMVQLYLPDEGKYRKRDFKGPLRVVDKFSSIASAPRPPEQQVEAAQQAKALQAQFTRQMEKEAVAAGVTPIRVQLPVRGKLFRLEKILALDEELWVDFKYSKWKKD